MTSVLPSLTLMVLLGLPAAAPAQFVKGNEAVKALSDGTRKVEVPQTPSVSLGSPCPATKPGCAGGGWKMLEGGSGLMECTEIFARATTCRPSTFGIEKRSRAWIVKVNDQWMQCPRPRIDAQCISIKSFPISAVQ